MRQRCKNTNHISYRSHGGRGIFVCDEWDNDYTVFRDWAMANGYAKGLHIDRKENNGNYEPNNCRWITPMQNSNNTRQNVNVTINWETKSISQWCREKGIAQGTVSKRMRLGWSEEHWFEPPNKNRTKGKYINGNVTNNR